MTSARRRFVRALVLALAALTLSTPARAQGVPPVDTVVMPFENARTEPRLHWLSEGVAVQLTDVLERTGIAVIDREERLEAFERLQLPPAATLSHATVIKLGQLMGAGEVIVGSFDLSDDQLTIRARGIRLDSGRLSDERVERGPLPDVLGIIERLAIALRTGVRPSGTSTGTTAPAFEFYVKGLIAETPSTQISFLEQAQEAAPSDDRPKLSLWHVLTEQGQHLQALDVIQAVPTTSRWSRTARYRAALSQMALKRYADAFAALKALQSEARSAAVANAMGIVQLARGSTPQTGRATYFFNQAAEIDPDDPDYFFNLGYAYALEKDAPAAVYWLREAVRRDPGDGTAHHVLASALQQTGATAEATRERELARRLSGRVDPYENRTIASGELVPRGLERNKPRLERRATRVRSVITASGQRDQAALAQFHLDAARRAFEREADAEAEQELRRALFLSPYLADAHLMLGRIHLRRRQPAAAVLDLKIALWSRETVDAHLALAEAYLQLDDASAAKAEVDRALALEPTHPDALALRERLARR